MSEIEIEIEATHDISSSHIINCIMASLSEDEIFNFIKEIDEDVGDWYFTNRLYEFFLKKHKEFLDDEGINESTYQEEYIPCVPVDVRENRIEQRHRNEDVFDTRKNYPVSDEKKSSTNKNVVIEEML